MAFDFEALVGHLYVVGGRAINAAPPGALVEIAPQKAERGREMDTIFVLVLPSGDSNAPTAFYERMAQLAADTYFKTSSSVTAGIRTVFKTLNENLFEHNTRTKQHYEASLLCGVLHNDDLYIGRIGSGVAVVRVNGETKTFPDDLSNDEAVFSPPLGVQPVANVRMTRYSIANGSRMILADYNLAELAQNKIIMSLQTRDISAVLATLKELAVLQLTTMVAEFVPPDVPAPLPAHEGESTVTIQEDVAAAKAQTRKPEAGEKPVRQRRNPLEGLQTRIRRGLSAVILGIARGLGLFGKVFDRLFPQPDESEIEASRGRWYTRTWIAGATVLIPVGVVLLVMMLWLADADVSDYEQCVREAQDSAALARGVESSNREGVLAAWSAVLVNVERCLQVRPDDTVLLPLRDEGQSIIDAINRITRREAIPIISFPNATLSQIVLQGNNLFVLDTANGIVYNAQLAPDGRSASSNVGQPITGLSTGGSVDGFTMGTVIGIAYDDQENLIAAVDSSGLLVRCRTSILVQCDALRLIGAESWVNPVRITFYQGRLYVLDPGAGSGQIWRYEASTGTYPSAPSEYFVSVRPPLNDAVDFNIDNDGAVYVLQASGMITKYFNSQAVVFEYAGFPEDGQEITSATAMYLNDNPVFQTILIVSRSTRTIYETLFSGSFNSSYRATDETLFSLIADAVASPTQRLIYVTSGNSVLLIEQSDG